MSESGLFVAVTTFPDRDRAEDVARILVEAGLAVCAQVGADLVSFYRWEGAVQRDAEVALALKVLPERWPLCAAELKQRHPYAVPQILAWPAPHVDAAYLDWARGRGEEES